MSQIYTTRRWNEQLELYTEVDVFISEMWDKTRQDGGWPYNCTCEELGSGEQFHYHTNWLEKQAA